MADDVQIITGTGALAAARLCNFPTGRATLLQAHRAWLEVQLLGAVSSSAAPWIDVVGYASKLGSATFNQQLSFQRCEAVKLAIRGKKASATFNVELAKGESESLGSESNDDGYWRAVDVYGFGVKPPRPVRKPVPVPPAGSQAFKIRIRTGVSGTSPFLNGPQGDAYYFEIVDIPRRRHAFFGYAGAGLALPTFVPIFLSLTVEGPFTHFHTSRGEPLASFAGRASLFQDPGITLGPGSVGGKYRLALRSPTLVSHLTLVTPGIIPLSGGAGISVTVASATEGTLKMISTDLPYTGP